MLVGSVRRGIRTTESWNTPFFCEEKLENAKRFQIGRIDCCYIRPFRQEVPSGPKTDCYDEDDAQYQWESAE